MTEQTLVAQIRDGKGKEDARRLRRNGMIPAVVYGHHDEPVHIFLNPQELTKVLRRGAGDRTLIDLTIEGGKGRPQKTRVILKDKQMDTLKGMLLHVDLYRIAMDEELSLSIPIHIVGKAEGVEKGGIVDQILRELEIRCLPSDIPPPIEVDVTSLEIGDAIHVRDLKVAKATILTDPDQAIVAVAAPTVFEEAAPEEVEAAEEGMEVTEEAPEEEAE